MIIMRYNNKLTKYNDKDKNKVDSQCEMGLINIFSDKSVPDNKDIVHATAIYKCRPHYFRYYNDVWVNHFIFNMMKKN